MIYRSSLFPKGNYIFQNNSDLKSLTKENINYIKKLDNVSNITFHIKNTQGINARDIEKLRLIDPTIKIRITGSYTEELIKEEEKKYSRNGYNHISHMREDSTYDLNTIEKILRKIEVIEKRMSPNWTNDQKLVYIINYIKRNIYYHPNYEQVSSQEIRSLKGLLTNQTVCAGYAIILKEFCDRHNIPCDYILGKVENEDEIYARHAWNVIKINGQYIPIDLTWSASKRANGIYQSEYEDVGNVNEFITNHIPEEYPQFAKYKNNLYNLNINKLVIMNRLINNGVTYNNSFEFKSDNGYIFKGYTVLQERAADGSVLYQNIVYYKDGKGTEYGPISISTKTNLLGIYLLIKRTEKALFEVKKYMNKNKLNSNERQELTELLQEVKNYKFCEDAKKQISNSLLHIENFKRAQKYHSTYIGELEINKDEVLTVNGVIYDNAKINKTYTQNAIIQRSNGTKLLIEKKEYNAELGLYLFRIHEKIKDENGNEILKTNIVTTEIDLIQYSNIKEVGDIFLSRQRLDRKELETYGYIGYFILDENKRIKEKYTNEKEKKDFLTIINYYSQFKPEDVIKPYENITYQTIKTYIKDYKLNLNNNKVIKIATNAEITDEILKTRIRFAKKYANELYGFNGDINQIANKIDSERQTTLFNCFKNAVIKSLKEKHYIDGHEIFKEIILKCGDNHDAHKIYNLLNNKETLNLIANTFISENMSIIYNPKNDKVIPTTSLEDELKVLYHQSISYEPYKIDIIENGKITGSKKR